MHAFIIITDKCNLRCSYCYYNKKLIKQTNYTISLNDFNKISCWLSRVGFKSISITGGEPTLVPYLLDCIKILKNIGLTSFLITNGTNLSQEFCSKLLNNGLYGITISLDSFSEKIHNKYRGRAKDVLQGLNNLINIGFKVIEVSLVLNPANRNEIINTIRKIIELNCMISLSFPFYDEKKIQDINNPTPVINKLLNLSFIDEIDRTFLNAFKKYYEEKVIPKNNCKMGNNYFYINSQGKLLQCPFKKNEFIKNFLTLSKEEFLKQKDIKYKRHNYKECFTNACINHVLDLL